MNSVNIKDILNKFISEAVSNDYILTNEYYKSLIKRPLSVKQKLHVIEELINNDIDFSQVDELDIDYSKIDTKQYDDNVALYISDIGNYKLLTKEEEYELGKRIKRGDKEALETLIKSNTRLVVSIAQRYTNLGVDLMDLIQEGNIGLMKAAKIFDYTKGCRFSTLATIWIKQAIIASIKKDSRTISIPMKLRDKALKIQAVREKYCMIHGEYPSDDYVAEQFNIPSHQIKEIQTIFSPIASLDYTYDDQHEDTNYNLENVIAADQIETEQTIIDKNMKEDIKTILNSLSERERFILVKRFGLDDGEAKTLEQVGAILNLTKERIRQIEQGALRKLRHPARSSLVKDYIEN